MTTSIWTVLGIAETTDERAIKRAYASRLKVTSPEVDAAGYMELRDAYEAAKHYARVQRHREEQEAAEPTAVTAPTEDQKPHVSPQQEALARLFALLTDGKLDAFLEEVESIKASHLFSTLDEQHDFVGEISVLVLQSDVQDSEWLGRLAAVLGAREGENTFPPGTHFWHAYGVLLHNYSQLRAESVRALEQKQDSLVSSPGYLHVFHVLTAPFDSERLAALTLSQNYHKLAESILRSAESDSTIVIPRENREWWDRTAMAGLHRPMPDPILETPTSAPSTSGSSSSFPLWPFWIVFMILINSFRSCDSSSSISYGPDTRTRSSTDSYSLLMTADPRLLNRLLTCDAKTRVKVLSHLREARQANPGKTSTSPENDPLVMELLKNCPAAPQPPP